jgi:hypothetical protein
VLTFAQWGTPPETVPHSLQASIIPLLGSNHKPLYVKTLSFAAYPPAFLVPLVLQSDQSSRALPESPLPGLAARLFSC